MGDEIFRFANPHAFYYLAFVLLFIALYLLFDKKRNALLETPLGDKVFQVLSESVSLRKRNLKRALQVITLILFIFTWARPQSGKSEQKVKSEGIELMFLVDVSNSMLTEDIKPSRLELAKKELKRFLNYSAGDKIGLIAFAGSAILLSPMTQDKGALKMYIDSLSPDSVYTQGTVFKKALSEAQSAFVRGGIEGDDKSHVTRAIILVSDGEDNEQGALEAAESLLKDGVRIFSLAVGTEKGGTIPVRNKRGELKGFRKDKSNQIILSKTKGTILKKLAEKGKGSFHHLTFGSDVMRKVSDDIKKLDKAEFDNSTVAQYNEKFQLVLLFGIFFLFLEMSLGEKRTQGRLWFGRFEKMEN